MTRVRFQNAKTLPYAKTIPQQVYITDNPGPYLTAYHVERIDNLNGYHLTICLNCITVSPGHVREFRV